MFKVAPPNTTNAKSSNSGLFQKEKGEQAFIQPKLNIGKPNDKYEAEADAVADKVVANGKESTTSTFFSSSSIIQKQPEEELQKEVQEKSLATSITPIVQLQTEEEDIQQKDDEDIQEKCEACEKKPKESSPLDGQQKCETCQKKSILQTKGETETSGNLETTLNSSKGKGSKMPEQTRTSMEEGFGTDFNEVKIHTDSTAVQMNKNLGAQAFTNGNDIYFNEGKYNPESDSGKHLLAHELTHTIQQKGTTKVQKKDIIIQRKTASEAVDIIEDRLQGYTSGWDSADILSEFSGQSATQLHNIIEELKRRASNNSETRDGMIDWLFYDMTEEDGRTLRNLLIDAQVTDVNRLVANGVYDLLSGYTSEANSREIFSLLSRFSGSQLDNVLYRLELKSELASEATSEWLFDDLTSVDGEKLRVHFLTYGGIRAQQQYGAKYSAQKIYDLISGYTSVADSWSVVSNFERTPQASRNLVLFELNNLTGTEWGERGAADALMQDLSYSDYEKLRILPGMILPVYDYEAGWLQTGWEGLLTGLDWIAMIVQWTVCGLVGIVTGVLSVVWDIVVLVKDLVVAVYDIIGMIVYFASFGAAGSAEWLAVKDFFRGLGQLFSAPGEVIDKAIEELVLEGTLIEGPFEACQEAEFWTRKVVNLIVNILLIFVAGYGAVKGGASALKTIAQVISKSGFRKGISELAAMILKGGSVLVSGLGDDVVKVITALKNPVETMGVISQRLSTIKLAAADQGYWQFLRQQAGATVSAEVEFWQQQRAYWTESAAAQEARLAEIDGKVGGLMGDVEQNKLPPNAESTVDDIERSTKALSDDADELHTRVTRDGSEGQPVRDTDGPTTPRSEIDTLAVETHRMPDGHEIKVLGDGRVFICSDPCTEIAELGGRVELFTEIVETGLESRKFANAIKNIAARNNVPIDDFMNAVRTIQARGGAESTRLSSILDELAAGGESTAATADFMERVTRIITDPEVSFNLAELHDAFRRGDAILDHGPLQTPIYFDKEHELIEGILWQTPSGARPAKQITKTWGGTVDFVIFDRGSGLELVLGRNHSGLSGGRAFVFGAGELRVTKSGDIIRITNLSGHYLPTGGNLQRAYQWLIDNGYLLPGIEVAPF